nr:hypothetical protein [Bradyrhizobium uaiense]
MISFDDANVLAQAKVTAIAGASESDLEFAILHDETVETSDGGCSSTIAADTSRPAISLLLSPEMDRYLSTGTAP